jgi:hypothetical protein
MSDAVDFDPAKDAANRRKHGLPLDRWPEFDAAPVLIEDRRGDYGEQRWWAIGRIDGKGHVVTFTWREGRVRMISFRRARDQEMQRYEQTTQALGIAGLG